MLTAATLCVVFGWLEAGAAVTIYGPTGQIPTPVVSASSATSAASATASAATLGAYNDIVLNAPPIPSPAPPTQFDVILQNSAQDVPGISIPHSGDFYGFSIEMSVIDQIIGINSTYINVPFLNLMATLQERGGGVNIRIGGNTQENATFVDSLPGGHAMAKAQGAWTTTSSSPELVLSLEFVYMLSNVSSLVKTKWYLGVPFNDTSAPRLQIAEAGEAILKDNLAGLQLGNEPDLYGGHYHRPSSYNETDYFDDFGVLVQAIAQDSKIPTKGNLIGPSIASGPWQPQEVWNTGYVTAYQSALGALSVEHYPDNNCAQVFPDSGFGPIKDPQVVFPDYLNHTSGVIIAQNYISSTALAQTVGKPFLMFETNTASCGGFPGLSDSFGAALWALDYGLQMAYSNFTGALLHVGGESDVYNPFTPPPTNQTTFHQWTIGPVFYASIAVAEAFGKSGKSQIVDLQTNGNNMYTPGYAIYESGSLAKVALFNYVTDPSGGSDYTATISNAGGAIPSEVYVKYLLAPSVGEKQNITWAGQTLGPRYSVDGLFKGQESIQTVQCSQTCAIKVPAPGFALVFLSKDALSSSEPTSTLSFATTAVTRKVNTATVDPSVLATAQGQSGSDRTKPGATSKGSGTNGASNMARLYPSTTVLSSLFIGAAIILRLTR